MRRFWLKLLAFLGPLVVIYSVPLFTMAFSRELLPVGKIARAHAGAASPNVVYGPAYTNPDKRYKLESLLLHDAPVLAVGTSRVMQLRSTFFSGGERTFYNAGGLVSRIWHVRRALTRIPKTSRTRQLLIGLDQWGYNDNWEWAHDEPAVEGEYTAETDELANLRYGLQAWPDLMHGKVSLAKLASSSDNLGIYARMQGNGFRRDGSYVYADILRDPASSADFEYKDTLARIRDKRLRYEAGSIVSQQALDETRRLLDDCRARGLDVVVFLPPFAPRILDALRASPDHTYLRAVPAQVRQLAEARGVPFYDFTSCADLGCTDAEFIDGSHGGDALFARLLMEMGRGTPWLAERLAADLGERSERSRGERTMKE